MKINSRSDARVYDAYLRTPFSGSGWGPFEIPSSTPSPPGVSIGNAEYPGVMLPTDLSQLPTIMDRDEEDITQSSAEV